MARGKRKEDVMNLRSLMFILALGINAPSGAGMVCPPLMTEKECTDHAHTLSRLPPGEEREAYLVAHAKLMREREKACSCSNYHLAALRSAPVSHPAALRNRF
jgi:hypothetical protein